MIWLVGSRTITDAWFGASLDLSPITGEGLSTRYLIVLCVPACC